MSIKAVLRKKQPQWSFKLVAQIIEDVSRLDINIAALSVVLFLPVSRGEGALISANDSELIVRLWLAGPWPVTTTDG